MPSSKTLGDWNENLPAPAVAATIVKITGSAPQQVGIKMWVTETEFFGTVGGGEFEFQVLAHARALLTQPEAASHLKEYVLCRQMGQCCGGRVEVFFEPVLRKKTLHVFGAGHVGRALSQVISEMPLAVRLIDPRPEWANSEGLPKDVEVRLADPIQYAQSLSSSVHDAVCIMTHSHDLDFLLVRQFLAAPLGYLGLIGSQHKAEVFQARLQSIPDEGARLQELWEERMHCPIGIDLKSKNPKIIAVSIAAELLKEWGLKPVADKVGAS